MADKEKKRISKKKKEQNEEDLKPKKDEPTKEEYEIANFLRKNVQIKKTKFLNHTVEYFIANKAVDSLMNSNWAKSTKKDEDPLFTCRSDVTEYMNMLLRHKFFHRARKIVVPEKELKKKNKSKDKEKETEDKSKSNKPVSEEKKSIQEGGDEANADKNGDTDGNAPKDSSEKSKETTTKKKRKIRLDMHLEQIFVDGTDAYVWLYEPTPVYYYFFGFLVVVAVIAVCLFPLWPSSVRLGVYYLSLGAAGSLIFILALAVIRFVLFCIIWSLTLGRHHLWLLPNLTEDVGFLASFWPLYHYEYKGGDNDSSKAEPSSSSRKEKPDESSDEAPLKEDQHSDRSKDEGDEENENVNMEAKTGGSGSESEESGRSQSDKDFEIVDHAEVDQAS